MRISDWSSDVCSSDLLVLERSLYSFLYKHQSDLPDIDDNAHYKERFHMAFRDSEVTMDRVIDTIMFCLITRSTVIWDVLEYVAQEAGHEFVLTTEEGSAIPSAISKHIAGQQSARDRKSVEEGKNV